MSWHKQHSSFSENPFNKPIIDRCINCGQSKEVAKEVAETAKEVAQETAKESVKEAISQADVDQAWNDYVGLQSQGKYGEAEQARQKMLDIRYEKWKQDNNIK